MKSNKRNENGVRVSVCFGEMAINDASTLNESEEKGQKRSSRKQKYHEFHHVCLNTSLENPSKLANSKKSSRRERKMPQKYAAP